MIWKQDSFWLKMMQGYKKREIEKNIAAVKQFAEVSLQKGISKHKVYFRVMILELGSHNI